MSTSEIVINEFIDRLAMGMLYGYMWFGLTWVGVKGWNKIKKMKRA